ncbi:ubiquitin-like protein SMT3 [Tanacetum coccineum]
MDALVRLKKHSTVSTIDQSVNLYLCPPYYHVFNFGTHGNEVFFRIERSTQLKKLISAYCDRKSIEINSIAFLFDERHLRGEHTPDKAGDFLESLGNELGLEVPPDEPYAEKHCGCWSGYSYCKDGYFGDEFAEVVISSLRLVMTRAVCLRIQIWFPFQDNIEDNAPNSATSASAMLDEVNFNGTSHGGNSSSDNEVVVGEDGTSTSDPNPFIQQNKETDGDLKMVDNPDAT